MAISLSTEQTIAGIECRTEDGALVATIKWLTGVKCWIVEQPRDHPHRIDTMNWLRLDTLKAAEFVALAIAYEQAARRA